MSRKPRNKKQIKKPQQQAMFDHHPLEIPYKRGKVPQVVVRSVFREPGAVMGAFAVNWMSVQQLSTMLYGVFYGKEEHFVQARLLLRKTGVNLRPNRTYFEGLALIEKALPNLLSREDLAVALDVELKDVDTMIRYLRGFVMTMCGLSILKNSHGEVSIATIDMWMDWQNHLTRTQNGIQRSKEKQGYKEDNLKPNGLRVAERLPSIQPMMLEIIPPRGRVKNAGD
ncbi:hypothetical protein [Deinococcus marmoris]|uniref:Uncharacterized protein n=1 Tax=Deinococcus marmoris TaxID=249408 RepID=A0A1U7P4Y7_9DEIO|nr:hypothetical protein [Deinococcus marmoris]OLV20233.1 hypothetical protein BOO71_0000727 [Deinococcus marmoris]